MTSDPRAVPEGEVRERLLRSDDEYGMRLVLMCPRAFPVTLARAGLRWDGTQYLDTEGSQE